MVEMVLLVAAAATAYAVAQRLGLPSAPTLVAAGALLAVFRHPEPAYLGEALTLGVAFLLFLAGLELNPMRVRQQQRAAVRVGLVQFFTMGAVGALGALLLGFGALSAAYVGLALTASSTLVVVRLLQQRRRLIEPSARLVLGVLLLQDVLVILCIPLITRLSAGASAVVGGMLLLALLLAIAYGTLRLLAPQLLRLDRHPELLLLAALSVLFIFIGLAAIADLPIVVGAFLAGVSLSAFPVNGVVRVQLAPIGEFFTALFFTALGALLFDTTPTQLWQGLILAAVVILATPVLVTFVVERAGLSTRPALEAGVLLAQASELSLVVGLQGALTGQISDHVFSVIAVATVLTMVSTPFLSRDRVVWWLLQRYPRRATPSAPIPEHDHVLLLGSGATGMPLLETILATGAEVVVIDDDPGVIARLQEADVPCIRGEATDVDVLRQANAASARVITSTVRRPMDNQRVLEFARGVPVLVRVFDDEDAEWVRSAGGIPVVYAEAAAEGMLEWYDKHRDDIAAHRLRPRGIVDRRDRRRRGPPQPPESSVTSGRAMRTTSPEST
ncbi:MAG TPA: cation:proton antiporter [Longimicrobiales bacterium]|nr:cation:proton antiporter [Longimicrobiales bacterium]